VKRRWKEYVQGPFLRALREVPWFGPVISALLVTMMVDLLTQAVTAWGGLWLGWGVVGLLFVATVVFVYAYALSISRRTKQGLGTLIDLPRPDKHRGLIFLFSREDTLREAIRYHLPALKYCWLLVTPQMRERATNCEGEFPDVTFFPHPLVDHYDSQGTYRTIVRIYREDARRLGISSREIIADITGGTKPMTLGLVLACLEAEPPYPIEHVPTVFDAEEATRPLPPIQIVVRKEAI
jgi:hypothetical protein